MSMESNYRRIVVKVGSNVLTRADGNLDLERMATLVDQISVLHGAGVELILVSSGAVASGRGQVKPLKNMDSVSSRQLFSAVGQVKLINEYYELFRSKQIVCGQVLTSKENFATRRHYLNQRNCMEVMLDNGIIPIVNENDTVSVTELMFTDNDELSGIVATMMNADALIILSNIDGIYNGDPKNPESKVIARVEQGQDLSQFVQASRSGFGRGGMITKYRISQKVADEGVEVIIANGCRDNILLELLKVDADVVSTRFVASSKISGVKKWIAHSDSFTKGELHINQGAVDVLLKDSASSLLAVGVVDVCGEFERDEIVKIIGSDGVQIGVGRVGCSSAKAREDMGKKGVKPFIHYDYLYID